MIGAGVVVLILLALVLYSSTASRNKSEDVVKSITAQDEMTNHAMPKDVMGMESKWKTFSGTAPLSVDKSTAAWTGSKSAIATWVDTGSIKFLSGTVLFENGKIKSAEAVADVNSITALTTGKGDGQDQLSQHLKSADFFDAAKFPTAKLIVLSATHEREEGGKHYYKFTGEMEIKGVKAPVEFSGYVQYMEDGAKLTAKLELDRTKWGVNFGSSKLKDAFIKDTFTLDVAVVATMAETMMMEKSN